MKKLIITCNLKYDPIRQYTQSGTCQMKCPLGDCVLELVLTNALGNIVQAVDVKGIKENK